MKKNSIFFFISLVICVIHPAADKYEPEMTEIKKYQDVEPFAGKMVAVTLDNYCIFVRNDKEWRVESTIFAYVDPGIIDGGDGYLLNRVLEKNFASGYAILNDRMIKKSGSIKVRLATYNEILKLKKGIEEDTLTFESLWMYLGEEKERKITKMLDTNTPAGSSIKPAKR